MLCGFIAWVCIPSQAHGPQLIESRDVLSCLRQVAERGGLRVQDGFFARFCIDRLGAGVQFLRDNPAGVVAPAYEP